MSVRAVNWAFFQAPQRTSEKLVLVVLAHRHNEKTGLCCPSVQALVSLTGLCERAVRYALRGLESQGLIRARSRRRGGSFTSNAYDLLLGRAAARPRGVGQETADGEPDPVGAPAAPNREEIPYQEEEEPYQAEIPSQKEDPRFDEEGLSNSGRVF